MVIFSEDVLFSNCSDGEDTSGITRSTPRETAHFKPPILQPRGLTETTSSAAEAEANVHLAESRFDQNSQTSDAAFGGRSPTSLRNLSLASLLEASPLSPWEDSGDPRRKNPLHNPSESRISKNPHVPPKRPLRAQPRAIPTRKLLFKKKTLNNLMQERVSAQARARANALDFGFVDEVQLDPFSWLNPSPVEERSESKLLLQAHPSHASVSSIESLSSIECSPPTDLSASALAAALLKTLFGTGNCRALDGDVKDVCNANLLIAFVDGKEEQVGATHIFLRFGALTAECDTRFIRERVPSIPFGKNLMTIVSHFDAASAVRGLVGKQLSLTSGGTAPRLQSLASSLFLVSEFGNGMQLLCTMLGVKHNPGPTTTVSNQNAVTQSTQADSPKPLLKRSSEDSSVPPVQLVGDELFEDFSPKRRKRDAGLQLLSSRYGYEGLEEECFQKKVLETPPRTPILGRKWGGDESTPEAPKHLFHMTKKALGRRGMIEAGRDLGDFCNDSPSSSHGEEGRKNGVSSNGLSSIFFSQ